MRRRPIGEQVDWAKGPLLIEIDTLPIAAVAALETQVTQRLPGAIAGVKVQIRFEAYLPMPVYRAAVRLHPDAAELGIGVEVDPDLRQGRQIRLHPFEQGDLAGSAAPAKVGR